MATWTSAISTDGARVVADHGVDGVEPALFVPRYRVDTASAVRECPAVAGHHQRRIAFRDQFEGREIAAQWIPVETTLERDRGSHRGQQVIAGEQQLVRLRPQADVAERMSGGVEDFPLSLADGDDLAALQASGCLHDGVQVRQPRDERVRECG